MNKTIFDLDKQDVASYVLLRLVPRLELRAIRN